MDEPKSKSQKKREAHALQALGVQLIALKPSQLEALQLPQALFQAICEAKEIKSNEALRRHKQWIGKLMRKVPYEPIEEALHLLLAEENAKTAHFHELEHWRFRLIHEGPEALTAFITQHAITDTQNLRQLIKKAVNEKDTGKPVGAAKALFRFLRTL